MRDVTGRAVYEPLERRRLLTVIDYDGDLDGVDPGIWSQFFTGTVAGPLNVNGTAKNDRVVISRNAENTTLFATVNGVTRSYSRATVTSIVIDTRRGDDLVQILSTDGVIDVPITVWTHAGRDTIEGGGGPERLNAGDDDDIVNGGNGRDTIYGGPGPGNDSLRGGGGSDLIDGEDGDDTLRGDAGNDNLSGGNGFDRLRGSDGNDQLHGGANKDFLGGEAGDDSLYGEGGNDVCDGGAGDASLSGGAGDDDSLFGDSGSDAFDNSGEQKDASGDVSIAGGAKLDLNNNSVVISNGIQSGRNSGAWTGTGIVTSAATLSKGVELTTVGVGYNAGSGGGLGKSTFGGVSVTASDILTMYTYAGDATLDGQIKGDDYFRMDSHTAGTTGFTAISYHNGDLNYDGVVDFDDYMIIDSNLLSPRPLVVNGTRKNDRIAVYRDSAGSYFSKINDIVNAISTPSSIRIDGLGGDDIIELLDPPYYVFQTTIYGGAGNDTITGSIGDDRIFAGDGNDIVNSGGGKDTVYGEAGNDSLRGGGGSDLLNGGAGNDTLRGDAGNDHLYGHDGFDRLRGSGGNDDLYGGASKDFLGGEDGDDLLLGEGGNDVLSGGAGTDVLDGGAGDDLELID